MHPLLRPALQLFALAVLAAPMAASNIPPQIAADWKSRVVALRTAPPAEQRSAAERLRQEASAVKSAGFDRDAFVAYAETYLAHSEDAWRRRASKFNFKEVPPDFATELANVRQAAAWALTLRQPDAAKLTTLLGEWIKLLPTGGPFINHAVAITLLPGVARAAVIPAVDPAVWSEFLGAVEKAWPDQPGTPTPLLLARAHFHLSLGAAWSGTNNGHPLTAAQTPLGESLLRSAAARADLQWLDHLRLAVADGQAGRVDPARQRLKTIADSAATNGLVDPQNATLTAQNWLRLALAQLTFWPTREQARAEALPSIDRAAAVLPSGGDDAVLIAIARQLIDDQPSELTSTQSMQIVSAQPELAGRYRFAQSRAQFVAQLFSVAELPNPDLAIARIDPELDPAGFARTQAQLANDLASRAPRARWTWPASDARRKEKIGVMRDVWSELERIRDSAPYSPGLHYAAHTTFAGDLYTALGARARSTFPAADVPLEKSIYTASDLTPSSGLLDKPGTPEFLNVTRGIRHFDAQLRLALLQSLDAVSDDAALLASGPWLLKSTSHIPRLAPELAEETEDLRRPVAARVAAAQARVQAAKAAQAAANAARDRRAEAGLDFTVTPERRQPTYTPPAQTSQPETPIRCSICSGSGTTYTTTSYSNKSPQTCWRCKGRGQYMPWQ